MSHPSHGGGAWMMTIEEMREHEWVVSWSGGKDSTATIILMHENHVPIKEIVYVRMMFDDVTPATLPLMTEFVDKARIVFEEWGYKVRYVYPRKTLKDCLNRIYQKSKYVERNGHPYGVTALGRGFCSMTNEKKLAIEASISPDDYQMIGYAVDEDQRLHRLSGKKESIMVALGIEENDAFSICQKYDLLSPLYSLGIPRDGCWFCPSAGKRERC